MLIVDGLTSCDSVDVSGRFIGLPLLFKNPWHSRAHPLNPPHSRLTTLLHRRIFGPMLAYLRGGSGKDSVSRIKRPDGVHKQGEMPRPE